MATEPKLKRITVKYKNPNPLFEKWITEWLEQAKAKDSKMRHVFKNALSTLKKYPLPLDSGKDCIILNGFGKKLCSMLDKKLKQYKAINSKNSERVSNIENNSDCEIVETINFAVPSTSTCINVSIGKVISETRISFHKEQNVKPSKTRTYKPVKRSGAYAILLVLLKNSQKSDNSAYMTKEEIIEQAKDFCDKSFLKPDAGSRYTAWSSMSTLIRKELVNKSNNPAKFSLTDDGKEVASLLFQNEDINIPDKTENVNVRLFTNNVAEIENVQPSINNEQFSKSSKSSDTNILSRVDNYSSKSTRETIIFAPYTFDIILLVDTQETAGGSMNPLDDETIAELSALNVCFEVRHLKVGDFTWICRERSSKCELILPYIVERKRIDDLGQSIKDGRFHEQKYRLKQCKIQNLLYIIESYKNNSHTGLPISSLMQAAANTLIQDNFQLKFTQNHRHSMQYLSGFTKMLTSIYERKTLMSCTKEDLIESTISDDLISLMPFNEFSKTASKMRNFRLREMFARQLLQLKGVSVEKALAITEKYPTPRLLKNEYDKLGKNGEKLLANIQYGPLKRSIGPAISTSIYQLYTSEKFL